MKHPAGESAPVCHCGKRLVRLPTGHMVCPVERAEFAAFVLAKRATSALAEGSDVLPTGGAEPNE